MTPGKRQTSVSTMAMTRACVILAVGMANQRGSAGQEMPKPPTFRFAHFLATIPEAETGPIPAPRNGASAPSVSPRSAILQPPAVWEDITTPPRPKPSPTPTNPPPSPPPPAVLPSPPPPSPPPPPPSSELSPLPNRPPFTLGFASAAYQFEGAYLEDGKGWSMWDVFANNFTGRYKCDNSQYGAKGLTPYEGCTIWKNETGNVAVDFYHRFKEDLTIAKRLHASSYRFSIAWTRIFPDGDGAVNDAGLEFYSDVVDYMLSLGIEPAVTLYHWDLPQVLQDRFGGWNNDAIAPIFARYAATVFKALGDKVIYWTTINEPNTFCWIGYGTSFQPPAANDPEQVANCTMNVLKAHAAAVKEFRSIIPGGKISMNLNSDWYLPLDEDSELDKVACQRRLDRVLGVFADPIFFGHFPYSVRARTPYLPEISPELADSLRGSIDYFALNHYTTMFVQHKFGERDPLGISDYTTWHNRTAGVYLGEHGESDWLYAVPFGFRNILNYVNDRYRPSEISVTENGYNIRGQSSNFVDDLSTSNDVMRINYFREYIQEATKAVVYDKVPLKNYHAWALTDNMEWTDGYRPHWGVVHVNLTTQERTLRASARFLANLFASDNE